ncbi:MAG TPA: hypothetical protein VMH27_22360 [Puia sp.]|nr:hypothetical protein [Puia sp.]
MPGCRRQDTQKYPTPITGNKAAGTLSPTPIKKLIPVKIADLDKPDRRQATGNTKQHQNPDHQNDTIFYAVAQPQMLDDNAERA